MLQTEEEYKKITKYVSYFMNIIQVSLVYFICYHMVLRIRDDIDISYKFLGEDTFFSPMVVFLMYSFISYLLADL
jgi:hypothetical protein